MSIKLSVIIPSYKDLSLVDTLKSLLKDFVLGDALEVIVVLDGYWPSFELVEDKKIRYIHLGQNRGMRGAINAGAAISRGEFIMKTDEHCVFSPGFDKVMIDVCEPNWVMTAPRYSLDTVKWEVMEGPPTIYERLTIAEDIRFAGVRWRKRDSARANIVIDETMAMQGSCWLMPKTWWDNVLGGAMQIEGYGSFANESQEITFKTWKAGGKLMINKNAWYAHRHRLIKRTHSLGRATLMPGWKYAIDTWYDYYVNEILPRWS